MHENRILVLAVNILTVWRAGFTWPHDTLPCVLMISFYVILHACYNTYFCSFSD